MTQDFWYSLTMALGLVFIIEGVIPFLNPGRWRKLVLKLAQVDDRTMRFMGLTSMLIGLGILYLVKN